MICSKIEINTASLIPAHFPLHTHNQDAWCPLDQMIATNSFLIERHALRIRQPITVEPDNSLFINCSVPGKGKRFGRIDFSEGFSQWWFLSHIDIHVPSEHTQEGKRYDAELQMHHFYSVNATVAGVDNQLGTVSTWLQSYDDVPPWRVLDMLICLWRQNEFETRQACGLHPIKGTYPGCFPLTGRKLRQQTNTESQENTEDDKKGKLSFETVQDLILAHHMRRNEIEQGILDEATAPELPKLQMEESNWGPPEKTDEEWAEFIANESTRMAEDEQLWQELHQEFDGDVDKAHEQFHARRKLIQGADLIWFNYFAMLAVRTEYYYRLTGSQTIPPCYGDFLYGTRAGDNNWRVMKDPIRIHPRQLVEMQRLIKERIAPKNAPLMACQPDTAAKIMSDGAPDTARPLQYESPAHNLVFCECPNWPSKWPEDRAWCRIQNLTDRLYDHPYNFETNGF